MRDCIVVEFTGERAERRADLRGAANAGLQRLVVGAAEGQLLGRAARTRRRAGDAQCDLGDDLAKLGYGPTIKIALDTSKLENLGWKAEIELEEAFERMIESMKETR